ncbi:MAG: hypothetical protein LBT22_08785 [Peptococcaceae bacterium]|nr:hypothetical protein [Peptococcaceae bacterium]
MENRGSDLHRRRPGAEKQKPAEGIHEKADSVFLKIDSGLSRREVSRKLAGIIAQKGYCGGLVIVYFTRTAELFRWNIDDLK